MRLISQVNGWTQDSSDFGPLWFLQGKHWFLVNRIKKIKNLKMQNVTRGIFLLNFNEKTKTAQTSYEMEDGYTLE